MITVGNAWAKPARVSGCRRRSAGRRVQRTTLYGRADAERQAAARLFDGLPGAARRPAGQAEPTLLTLGRRA